MQRYYHCSLTDHGQQLNVLEHRERPYDPFIHDFGGIFLTKEGKYNLVGGTRKIYSYYIDLEESEILTLSELKRNYSPDHKKIKKVLEFFDLFQTPYTMTRVKDYEDDNPKFDDDDLTFMWKVICGRRLYGDEYARLLNIEVMEGELAEWRLQTIQGQIAMELGYKAVELEDEQGNCYLLLGPNVVSKCYEP